MPWIPGRPNRRDDDLLDIVSADLSAPYDMRQVITRIMDQGQFLELQELFARTWS